MAGGHWRRTVTTGNYSDTTYFDAELRPVLDDTSTGAAGSDISTATGYDWAGRTVFAAYPVRGAPDVSGLALGVHASYDALGRPTQRQQDSELGLLTTTTAYLPGPGTQVTDPKGNVTITYDQAFDQPVYNAPWSVTTSGGITQSIARDIYGEPTVITQSGSYNGQAVSLSKAFYYDSYHRLCRTSEPETGSTVLAYDGANNLAWSANGLSLTGTGCDQVQVPASAQTTRRYDAMNRVLALVPPSGTASTGYSYDALGQLTREVSGIATWSGAYNSRGQLTGETLSLPGLSPMALGYSYDAYDHRATVSYPGGEAVAYAPNPRGLDSQAGSYATAVGYFPNGQVESFALGNGRSYLAEQNTRQQLSNFSYGAGGTLDVSEDLSYDADGNITAVTDLASGLRSKRFGYDALNRLTSATAPNLYGSESYSYDPLNNLRTRVAGGQSFAFNYDASNRLASITRGASTLDSFGYDTRGNQIRRNSVSLSFDASNRLTQIPGVESYVYDGEGRRVEKSPVGGTPSYFFYSHAGQLMYRYDSGTGAASNFIYLGGRLLARSVHVASNPAANHAAYEYTDPQGTPLAIANAQGGLVTRYDYTPYGTPVAALGTAPDGPGYTGHVSDAKTGLVYMQQRYYDPASGRFLSVDPVTPSPGNLYNFNRYGYANNNPARYIDPDGRTCTEANKTYTCQIDKVVTQQNGKLVTRNATAEDHKTYAGLEMALTKAVNAAASSGKAADISFKSGGTTYSFSIAGTSVAQNLAGRIIKADPFHPGNPKGNWAMITSGNTTTVGKYGLQPGRTVFGDVERTQEEEFLHEGIHQSLEESKALGFFGSRRMARRFQGPRAT